MKFTVAFLALLSISALAKEEPKDKREAPTSYVSSSGHSGGSSSYPATSIGHGDASSISVGAGYSIGGAKPSYSFGSHGSGGAPQFQSEGLPGSGHATIQLAPITLQPNHGIVGTDLSQIMSQLSQTLNSGSLSLHPSNTVAEFHESSHGGQSVSLPQFSYGAPKLQQYSLGGSIASAPTYSAGTKGLGSYSSTGPVLFNPSDAQQSNQQQLAYAPGAPHSLGDASSISLGGSGHSFGGQALGGAGHSFSAPEVSLGSAGLSLSGLAQSLGGHSFGGSGASLGGLGHSFGDSGHSLSAAGHSLGGSVPSFSSGGHSLGGAGHSLGGAGHSLGGSGHSLSGGHSLGGSGHSLGGSGHSLSGAGHSLGGSDNALGAFYKVSSIHSHAPSKGAFKPSTFLGTSVPSESGFSSQGSHGAPSFAGHPGGSHAGLSLGGHGSSFGSSYSGIGGSSKHISPLYTKSSGFGSSLDSAAAYSNAGHFASPPGTTYGFPTSSYPASAVHSASSGHPQYVSSSKFPSFGDFSSSFKGPSSSSHSSLSSSSGPKYSFGHSGPSSRYSPKDSHGAYSENVYNTIKYSEELKPRGQ